MQRCKIGLAVAALLLSACDLGRTKLGELPEDEGEQGEQEPIEPCDSWQVHPLADDGARTTADAILALDDGYIVGAGSSSNRITRTDADANEVWSLVISSAATDIRGIAAAPGGGFVIVDSQPDVDSPFGLGLWMRGVSDDGELEWESRLGHAQASAWGRADVLVHPEGGFIVGWHDGGGDIGFANVRLARVSEDGAPLWSNITELAPDSPIAQSWARGATALLPSGDAIQLTSNGDGLRIIATTADGETTADNAIDGVVAWPTDLIALPDGRIFVLTMRIGDTAQLLQVSTAGDVLASFEYTAGVDSALHTMVWNHVSGRLYLGGESRGPSGGTSQEWTVIVDGNGDEVLNHLVPGFGSMVLAAAPLPSGGFVASRHGMGLDLDQVTDCN